MKKNNYTVDQLLTYAGIEPTKRNKYIISERSLNYMINAQNGHPCAIDITSNDIWVGGCECIPKYIRKDRCENVWKEVPYIGLNDNRLKLSVYEFLSQGCPRAELMVLFTQYVILKNWENLFEKEFEAPEVNEASILYALIRQREAIYDYCLSTDGNATPMELHVLKLINDDYRAITRRMADFDLEYRDRYLSILDMSIVW